MTPREGGISETQQQRRRGKDIHRKGRRKPGHSTGCTKPVRTHQGKFGKSQPHLGQTEVGEARPEGVRSQTGRNGGQEISFLVREGRRRAPRGSALVSARRVELHKESGSCESISSGP